MDAVTDTKRLLAMHVQETRRLEQKLTELQDQAQNTAAMVAETGQTLLAVMERLRLLEERFSGE